jgi:ubiquinol-cytochrome c reductase cytochrome c subunit
MWSRSRDEEDDDMKRLIAPLAVVALTSAAAALAQTPAPTPPAPQRSAPTPAGNAQEGKKLFVSYGCYQCHGYEAQGSSATGPRLGPRPIAFTAFSRYVRQPTGQMPPYTAKVVSDMELADIYAYVGGRPAPPPVQSIPLLK